MVDDAIKKGVKGVWGQLTVEDEKAAEKARAAGLVMVMDHCMMVEHRKWARQRKTSA